MQARTVLLNIAAVIFSHLLGLLPDTAGSYELVQLGPEQIAGDHLAGDQHGRLGGVLHIHCNIKCY